MPYRDPNVRRRIFWQQLGAYLLIVGIGIYGFYQQDKDEYERCLSGNEIREVSRNNVLAVYDLALSLSQPPPGDTSPMTPEEQAQTQLFIDRITKFRDEQLSKIPGDRTCEDGIL